MPSDFDALVGFVDEQTARGRGDPARRRKCPELGGILDQTIHTRANGSDPTPDAIHKVITQAQNYYFEPDAVVLDPLTGSSFALLMAADGIYIFGSPNKRTRSLHLWQNMCV